MLSFSTAPFQFTLDEKPYMLPKIGFGDLEKTADIASQLTDNPAEGVKLVRALLVAKADKRTMEAIDKLSVPDTIALVRAWIGLNPGESSTSGDE